VNFKKHGRLAISECGNYEIRMSLTKEGGKEFCNAWHVPTDKHIEASFDREAVKAACIRHSLNENLEAERGTYG
jgi:hypothetical protein